MSILHCNIRSLRTHRNYLYLLYEPHVICLQETFLVRPPTPIPNYHFIHSPHSIAGASILIHHKTPYTYLNIDITIPCTVLRILLQRWITIVYDTSTPTLCMTCYNSFSVPHIVFLSLLLHELVFPHFSRPSRPPRLNDMLTESPHFYLYNIVSFLKQILILHLI